MAPNKEIRRLIKRLRNEEPPDTVIAELAAVGEPAIGPLLVLMDELSPARGRAQQAIFSMPGRGSEILIRQLSSRYAHRRASAAGLLAEIGTPEALLAIRAELERDIESMRHPWRRRWEIVRHILIAVGIFWAFLLIGYILIPSLRPRTPFLPIQFAIQAIVIVSTGISVAKPARSEFRRLAAQEISKLDDPQLVNLLSRLGNDDEEKVRLAANVGLKKLLPNVTAEQIQSVTVSDLINLVPRSNELSVHALRAIARTHDERALKCVAEVAADRTGYSKALVDEARSVLPVIRERILIAKQHAALLRPAEPVQEEVLLRPAANESAKSETLLRPSL